MSEISWVKLSVDVFDNRKIKYLRRLPDGDSIVLIWIMLLTMAGRCNANGLIFLTETIPYSAKMLADELGFDENTVKLALASFEQLEMIHIADDGRICVSGWGEHQNIDGMEKIRESKRLSQARWRAKQKALPPPTVVSTVDSTVDTTSISVDDAEEDIEERNKNILTSADKPPRKSKTFVPPTVEEVQQYVSEKRLSVDPKSFVDYFEAADWHDSKGQKVRSWRQKLLTWNKCNFGNGYNSPASVERSEIKGVIHF